MADANGDPVMDESTMEKHQKVFWLMIRRGSLKYLMKMMPFHSREKKARFVNFAWNVRPDRPPVSMLCEAIRTVSRKRDVTIELVKFLIDCGASADEPGLLNYIRDLFEHERRTGYGGYNLDVRLIWLILDATTRPVAIDLTWVMDLHHRASGLLAHALAKATPEAINGEGRDVPLMKALGHQVTHAGVAEMLLDRGADPNVPVRRGIVDYPMLVLAVPNIALIDKLLRNGADPNARDANGRTALQHAARPARNGTGFDLQVVRVLLDAGADPNVFEVVYDGADTLLALAAGYNVASLFDELMRRRDPPGINVDVNMASPSGVTALMYAFDVDRVRTLLARGASIEPRDSRGRSALFYALIHGRVENARVFLGIPGAVTTVDLAEVEQKATVFRGVVSRPAEEARIIVARCTIAIDIGVQPTALLTRYLDDNTRPHDDVLSTLLARGAVIPREVHPHEHGTVVARRRAELVRAETGARAMEFMNIHDVGVRGIITDYIRMPGESDDEEEDDDDDDEL